MLQTHKNIKSFLLSTHLFFHIDIETEMDYTNRNKVLVPVTLFTLLMIRCNILQFRYQIIFLRNHVYSLLSTLKGTFPYIKIVLMKDQCRYLWSFFGWQIHHRC